MSSRGMIRPGPGVESSFPIVQNSIFNFLNLFIPNAEGFILAPLSAMEILASEGGRLSTGPTSKKDS